MYNEDALRHLDDKSAAPRNCHMMHAQPPSFFITMNTSVSNDIKKKLESINDRFFYDKSLNHKKIFNAMEKLKNILHACFENMKV